MEFLEIKATQHNCTIKRVDEKGKESVCSGQIKEWLTAPADVRIKVKKGNNLYRCRRCGAVYIGAVERHLIVGKSAIGLPPQFPTV